MDLLTAWHFFLLLEKRFLFFFSIFYVLFAACASGALKWRFDPDLIGPALLLFSAMQLSAALFEAPVLNALILTAGAVLATLMFSVGALSAISKALKKMRKEDFVDQIENNIRPFEPFASDEKLLNRVSLLNYNRSLQSSP